MIIIDNFQIFELAQATIGEQSADSDPRQPGSKEDPSSLIWQPQSLPAQQTWSRILQIWQVYRVAPDRTCHKSFQTVVCSIPPPNSSFREKFSEQQLLLSFLG